MAACAIASGVTWTASSTRAAPSAGPNTSGSRSCPARPAAAGRAAVPAARPRRRRRTRRRGPHRSSSASRRTRPSAGRHAGPGDRYQRFEMAVPTHEAEQNPHRRTLIAVRTRGRKTARRLVVHFMSHHQLTEMATMRRQDYMDDAARFRLRRKAREAHANPRAHHEAQPQQQTRRRRIWLPWGRADLT